MAKSTSITWWPAQEQKRAVEALNWHHQRGQAENFNKKLKWGFGMEQMPCGQSFANAVFFRIGVIAYNLFIGFKRLSGPPSWETQSIGTFRWKMLLAGSCAMAGRWSSNFVWRPGSGRSWKPLGESPLSFAWRPEGNRFAKADGIYRGGRGLSNSDGK